MNNYTVYKHITPNNKIYVGITSRSVYERWNKGYGYIGNQYFYRAIKKYGWENIKHEILFSGLTKEEACKKEIELIEHYQSNKRIYGYNISSGGEGGEAGVQFSEEHRLKISVALKGNKNPSGKPISEEHRKHLSDCKSGINHPFYGKHLSEEHKKHISDSNSKEKAYWYGKKIPESARKKMSEKQMGKNNNNYGKHFSLDHKNKLAKAHNIKTICVETGITYDSMLIASKLTGVCYSSISNCCNGKAKTAGGYHWKLIEKG